jgi:hypothetical protein
MSSQYRGYMLFNGEAVKEKLNKICVDITAKDPTFKSHIRKAVKTPGFEYLLVLYGSDKDQVWKRLTWIKNKSLDENTKPLLKDQNTPMWVRARGDAETETN